jgi:hypothetical protein
MYGGLGLPGHNVEKRITKDQQRIGSYCKKMLKEGKVPSVFGSSPEGLHPWMGEALKRTKQWEILTVREEETESAVLDTTWGALAEEEDGFWGVTERLSIYTPLLWHFAQKATFNSLSPESIRTKLLRMGDAKRKALERKQRKDPYSIFRQLNRRAQSLTQEEVLPIPDLFRPLTLERDTPAEYLELLNSFVPGPRVVLASILAPLQVTPVQYWPAESALTLRDRLEAYGRMDVDALVGGG